MILEKMLSFTKELFTETYPNQKYNKNMKKILNRLKDKSLKLEAQLENEKDESKRKEINLMLKIISKQQQKGVRLMQQKASCDNLHHTHKIMIKPVLSPKISLAN